MDEDNDDNEAEDSAVEKDTILVKDKQEDEEVVNDVQDNEERDMPEDTAYAAEDEENNVDMKGDNKRAYT